MGREEVPIGEQSTPLLLSPRVDIFRWVEGTVAGSRFPRELRSYLIDKEAGYFSAHRFPRPAV